MQVYAAVTELEDDEFNDPEFSANAHWLSCGEVYKKFTILLISTQDALETKGIPMEYTLEVCSWNYFSFIWEFRGEIV